VLTPRAWEVLFLLRHGLSNRKIAERLGISVAGAKFHVSEILSRLGVRSREEAAAWRPVGGARVPERVRFTRIVPMLRTKDLHATVGFYTDVLGFRCDSLSEADGWASLVRDDVRLMVALPNRHLPFDAPAFSGSLYFHVDDVSALWEAIGSRAQVCYPIEDFGYGMREFAIYDDNGYLLQFGAPARA
jgi:DNA-binding CsgD family transcriptional regulator/catechol 2,3-dioxygenase-like lactoylglutathione lyase family enzyme